MLTPAARRRSRSRSPRTVKVRDTGHELLALCRDDLPSELASRCQALSQDGCDLAGLLRAQVLPRLLSGGHQRPRAATVVMHTLAAAVVSVDGAVEDIIRWLCSFEGGTTGACDTGVRWRCCTLLVGLLWAAAKSEATLPTQIFTDVGVALVARARDRCADVRLTAVHGLRAMGLSATGAVEAVEERAQRDCNFQVRAAAVQTLIGRTRTVPLDLVSRARLDRAPRVRRFLLGSIKAKIEMRDSSWEAAWPTLVLQGLGDRSRAVRLAAVSCLHAGVKRGWPVALLENEALSEGVADRLVAGLVEILQGSDEPHLSSALCPERALQDVSENLSSRSALFARITAAVAAATGEPLDAGLVVPVLSHAMASGAAWIRQLLMGLVMAELPPGHPVQRMLPKLVNTNTNTSTAAALAALPPIHTGYLMDVRGKIPTRTTTREPATRGRHP